MGNQNFAATLLVDQSPKEVFDAFNNVRGWCSENIEGGTDKRNNEFVYHYRDIHYCKIKLIEMVPDRKVVWLVLDNYFKFTKDKNEWIGTKVVFEISQNAGQTVATFTHEGLVPQYECFDICREAWTNYIKYSLQNLITTGKGEPSGKDHDDFDVQMVEKWRLDQ